ncbi:polysaccharide pyruvyl transferase family protein [Nitratireductor kimnyeongensis]|uniref:Polysaccharide pyruvyl transferase family protein n=1 Tax=Nitratireductor kimnyeongensis TaxID=430679 RepID=A0ABW0T411_9HYPH|nr:polysaccharide pyruvyl transferase family protein [Nitratireductor kimnyeongensis]QZZ34848.1 polysaccharide pyruvyl transferase family protein [Nitratireductor kimnyeongensis]
MRIVIFNVRYSPNLGDGILAECLERQLGLALPDAEIETVDLAGRTSYGNQDQGRSGALRLLQSMPPLARRMLVERVIGSKLSALRESWREKIAAADAVIIGGGNLFQDDDLNFPLKIAQVLELCCEQGRPVAIHAVGVGQHWSRRAAILFGTLRRCKVIRVTVRDPDARRNWQEHFPDRPSPELAPDPALTLQPQSRDVQKRVRPLVGLCVTHPLILKRHAGAQVQHIPLATVPDYVALAAALLDSGRDVVFFTNGAVEDHACLKQIESKIADTRTAAFKRCRFAGRPDTPQELVALLGTLDVVVAHRLHACITAYALGVPPVGMGWDQKVEAFFRMIDREPFFVPTHRGEVGSIVERILTISGQKRDARYLPRYKEKAREAIEWLAEDLKTSTCGPRRESA